VIQADELSEAVTPLVVVLPLSMMTMPAGELFIRLGARDRLLQDSVVLTDQPRTIDRRRSGEGPLTRLSAAGLCAVENALRLVCWASHSCLPGRGGRTRVKLLHRRRSPGPAR
jgi:mRNA-degrading endonuclease toxin of MazEF toxin-antitoxin module